MSRRHFIASRKITWQRGGAQAWRATSWRSPGSITMKPFTASATQLNHCRRPLRISSNAAREKCVRLHPSLDGVIERRLRVHEVDSLQRDLELLATQQQRMSIHPREAA